MWSSCKLIRAVCWGGRNYLVGLLIGTFRMPVVVAVLQSLTRLEGLYRTSIHEVLLLQKRVEPWVSYTKKEGSSSKDGSKDGGCI